MHGQLKIDTMYAYIAVDEDGSEGIPAFVGPGQMFYPMVGADLERMTSMRSIAEAVAREGKPVTLVRFTNREEMEAIAGP